MVPVPARGGYILKVSSITFRAGGVSVNRHALDLDLAIPHSCYGEPGGHLFGVLESFQILCTDRGLAS